MDLYLYLLTIFCRGTHHDTAPTLPQTQALIPSLPFTGNPLVPLDGPSFPEVVGRETLSPTPIPVAASAPTKMSENAESEKDKQQDSGLEGGDISAKTVVCLFVCVVSRHLLTTPFCLARGTKTKGNSLETKYDIGYPKVCNFLSLVYLF